MIDSCAICSLGNPVLAYSRSAAVRKFSCKRWEFNDQEFRTEQRFKMCGIGGWLGHLTAGELYASRMAQALYHRGPDARGLQSWADATLVHTRLSIIDLSPAGAQPMSNEDGTIWTVFNGEIYNHRELRRLLEGRGHIFRGRSDTEVLPHLYEEEGPDFVSKLRGMFAFAIYDKRMRRLLLARDRFGIKPLFYAPSRNRLAFASEIPALLQLPEIDSRPDRQAIYDFATLLSIPAPETFYQGIRALEPGETLEARLDSHQLRWTTRRYHQWTIVPDYSLTLEAASTEAESLLSRAVDRQLQSDVPLGALLSGGIDSSLISASAQDKLNGKLRTFNVRFSEKQYDETWAALATAEHVGSRHQTLDMEDIRGSWENVTSLLLHAGQPFADTSLFAVNAVCRLMREHVTVALSGDGGDEGFGGYSLYWRIARIDSWQKLPLAVRLAAPAILAHLTFFSTMANRWPQRLRSLSATDDTAAVQSLFCWLPDEQHRALCRDTNLLPVRRWFEPQWQHHLPSGASRLDRLSAQTTEVNTRMLLANDFLFKVDTASMKESLEVRVPMLDEDLFSFGLSLPHHLKVKGRTCKRVLRAIAARRLPTAVANKSKSGFGIPFDSWVDPEVKARVRDVLLGSRTNLPEFFRPEVYRPLLKAFSEGQSIAGTPRDVLYQLAVMLLSVHLSLDVRSRDQLRVPKNFPQTTPLAV
jgi:asparagine synthase (glutamine-hydrolysing)